LEDLIGKLPKVRDQSSHLAPHRSNSSPWLVDSLKDYFSQFGEVSECTVMRDSATGRSRGFGFLTFKDPKCVNTVMVKEHYLDGKIVSIRTDVCHAMATLT
jgi:hypothetical protein